MKKFYYCLKENAEPDDEGNYDLYIGDGDAMDWKYDHGALQIHVGDDVYEDLMEDAEDDEDMFDDDYNPEDDEDTLVRYEDFIRDRVELNMLYDAFNDTFIAVDSINNDVQEIVGALCGHSADDITIVAMEEPTFYE